MKRDVIYCGDMGGDDLWAIAVLLAHEDTFNLLGISTVFGNVSQPLATRNVQNFLHWLNRDDIEVVRGADIPIDGCRPFGDDAYGEDGVGGYILPESPKEIRTVDIADWYAEKLKSASGKVTVFLTGPATNLALLAQKHPEKLDAIDKIIFMGGALETPGKDGLPAYMPDGMRRIGNITQFAEFNAYQDPAALNILLRSGIPMIFMAADASQNIVLTPERQTRIKALDSVYGPAFHQMLMAVEHLDKSKFNVDGPFIHDPNVVVAAIAPELYAGERKPEIAFTEADPRATDGDRRGQATLTGRNSNAVWLNAVMDPEKVFDIIEDALRKTIERASAAKTWI